MPPIHLLSEEEIRRRLANPLCLPAGMEHPLPRADVPAAVLIPFVRSPDGWKLLFTQRTHTVQTHKGQASFPGGAAEPGDRSPADTALREAYEEIGLDPSVVDILGSLQPMPTISGFCITPVAGAIPDNYPFSLSHHEVERVFTLPLDWLADPQNHEERTLELPPPMGRREGVVYFREVQGNLVWGVTARIVLNLLALLAVEA